MKKPFVNAHFKRNKLLFLALVPQEYFWYKTEFAIKEKSWQASKKPIKIRFNIALLHLTILC